jgi:hypothetical protein
MSDMVQFMADADVFLKEHPEYRNPILYRALDHEVRRIQAGDRARLFDLNTILEAHANVVGAFTIMGEIRKRRGEV